MTRIIYKTDAGSVAVIIPTQEAIDIYGIDAIAIKDVPAGKPYKIVDVSAIPSDRSEQAAQAVAIRISELKQLLRDTDYVALADYDKDKTDILAQRAAWRTELRGLGA